MPVCCTAGPIERMDGPGWPHNATRYHYLMPISCHFRDCKALLVTSSRVSSAIASTRPLPLPLPLAGYTRADRRRGRGTRRRTKRFSRETCPVWLVIKPMQKRTAIVESSVNMLRCTLRISFTQNASASAPGLCCRHPLSSGISEGRV